MIMFLKLECGILEESTGLNQGRRRVLSMIPLSNLAILGRPVKFSEAQFYL